MSLRESCKPQKKTIKQKEKKCEQERVDFHTSAATLDSYSKTQVKVHSRIGDKR
jgi:hypothetical protein